MFQKKHHNFAEIKLPDDKGIKVLQLPYNAAEGSKGLTMVLLLPNEVDGLKNLEGQLSAANVQSWIGQLKGVEVMTWLPKFQLTAAFELKPVLSSLGMPLAFDSRRRLLGYGRAKGFIPLASVSQGLCRRERRRHRSCCSDRRCDACHGHAGAEEPKQFKADHPFVFLIRDEASGCILFMGRERSAGIDCGFPEFPALDPGSAVI